MRSSKLQSLHLASIVVLVASASHACLPTSSTPNASPNLTTASQTGAGSNDPKAAIPVDVDEASRSSKPLPGARPAVAKNEPLLPIVDFAWNSDAIVLRPSPTPDPSEKAAAGSSDAPSARGSMWGTALDDATGTGALGLSGIGPGGGGSGVGLGSIGTIGHGARSGMSGLAGGTAPFPMGGIRTGEWDDDANYIEFQRYLASAATHGALPTDVRSRRFLVVRDSLGKAVPNCSIGVTGMDARGETLGRIRLTTTSSGRAILFPQIALPDSAKFTATAECALGEGTPPTQSFDARASDLAIPLDLQSQRSTSPDRTVDVGFILDTTGSMSEEIIALRSTIEKVASVLTKKGLTVRLGLVEYRDRNDPFVARVHPMTRDVNSFVSEVQTIRAGGGGDTPEDINAGLAVALDELAWSPDSIARLGFVIGDAPPHLDYRGEATYVDSMKRASRDGIELFTVAASGMDQMGQTVFRQIAMYTGATNLFILRGGAGPDSVGGGDPISSCGGTQKIFRTSELDKLITGKVESAIALLDQDPMSIPGLGADQIAKACQPGKP